MSMKHKGGTVLKRVAALVSGRCLGEAVNTPALPKERVLNLLPPAAVAVGRATVRRFDHTRLTLPVREVVSTGKFNIVAGQPDKVSRTAEGAATCAQWFLGEGLEFSVMWGRDRRDLGLFDRTTCKAITMAYGGDLASAYEQLTKGLAHTTDPELLHIQRDLLATATLKASERATLRHALERNERLVSAGLPGSLPSVAVLLETEAWLREEGGVYGDPGTT